MPVCPHDWRKHSCSFCPAESCCIMGVLKARGSEQACLTKPWWLASKTGEAVCEPAACQKLFFFLLSAGAQWRQHDSMRAFDRARAREGARRAAAEIRPSFVKLHGAALRSRKLDKLVAEGNILNFFPFLFFPTPSVRLQTPLCNLSAIARSVYSVELNSD